MLRFFTFFHSYGSVDEKDSIVYYLLNWDFNGKQVWVIFVSMILIFYQAAYINRLVGINKLSISNSLFPGIFYILILSIIPEIHPLSSTLVGNTFVIISLYHMFMIVHRIQRPKRIFNSAFYLCLASLFNIEYILLFPFFIMAANAFVAVKAKDLILYAVGIILPYYFLFSYLLLTGQVAAFTSQFLSNLDFFKYPFIYQNYGIVKVGIIGILSLLVIVTFTSAVSKTNIFARNKLEYILYLLIFSMVIFGLSTNIYLSDIQIVFIPLVVLLAVYIQQISKNNIAESFHFLLFIIAILFQYFLN